MGYILEQDVAHKHVASCQNLIVVTLTHSTLSSSTQQFEPWSCHTLEWACDVQFALALALPMDSRGQRSIYSPVQGSSYGPDSVLAISLMVLANGSSLRSFCWKCRHGRENNFMYILYTVDVYKFSAQYMFSVQTFYQGLGCRVGLDF